jgi:hypothetical protein
MAPPALRCAVQGFARFGGAELRERVVYPGRSQPIEKQSTEISALQDSGWSTSGSAIMAVEMAL